jgi:hypothetical protein
MVDSAHGRCQESPQQKIQQHRAAARLAARPGRGRSSSIPSAHGDQTNKHARLWKTPSTSFFSSSPLRSRLTIALASASHSRLLKLKTIAGSYRRSTISPTILEMSVCSFSAPAFFSPRCGAGRRVVCGCAGAGAGAAACAAAGRVRMPPPTTHLGSLGLGPGHRVVQRCHRLLEAVFPARHARGRGGRRLSALSAGKSRCSQLPGSALRSLQ